MLGLRAGENAFGEGGDGRLAAVGFDAAEEEGRAEGGPGEKGVFELLGVGFRELGQPGGEEVGWEGGGGDERVGGE